MAHIEIYTSPFCGYCHRAKALLENKGVEYEEYDVMMNPKKRMEMEKRTDGATTVPQVFIDGQLVGGCDDLYALDARDELDALLSAA